MMMGTTSDFEASGRGELHMAAKAEQQQDERVAGRVWTVRLDPHGRPSAGAVKVTCSRPACVDQPVPGGAAEGRRAALRHVNTHLARIHEGGGPRGGAWCACRAADCAWHTDPTARGTTHPAPRTSHCAGPVVLTVYADRPRRLWRIAETCANCAASPPGCRVLDTAAPADRARQADTSTAANPEPSEAMPAAAVFSDPRQAPTGPASPTTATALVPPARTPPLSRRQTQKRHGKIAQREVPPTLQPDSLRIDLIDLGDAYRDYQQRPEPDLVLLATLHERKAQAFTRWAEATGDHGLLAEAKRAAKAATTTREMHANRFGTQVGDAAPDGNRALVERLLTVSQAEHARAVLAYVNAHTPRPEADARLAVLMLVLRAARTGHGNLTGQDLIGWLPDRAEHVLQQLVDTDWLRLSGSVADAMVARSEDPTSFTIPTLLPDAAHPLTLGKTARARISGWAQKAVGDRKIRKKKLGAVTRLLAVYAAAHSSPDGHLGRPGEGLALLQAATFAALPCEQVAEHAQLLIAADWLSEADTTNGVLRGRLTERVLPLGGLL